MMNRLCICSIALVTLLPQTLGGGSSLSCNNDTKTQLCQAASDMCSIANRTHSADRLCDLLFADQPEQLEHRERPAPAQVWGYGFLFVTLISLTSVIGVSVMPIMSKAFYDSLLTSLIGLAVGSLTGSAVFHLIPSAFSLASVDQFPHHSYLYISIVIFGGIYLFFVIERFLKLFMDYKNRKKGTSGAVRHSHSHTETKLLSVPVTDSLEPIADEQNSVSPTAEGDKRRDVYEHSKQAIKASFGHLEKPEQQNRMTVDKVKSFETSPIATVAWMIIFGDGVHNFIDGLSIGAAFSESILTGMSVSLAVLCEEFPHELGDFAVLLNSGMTIKQAMSYNFLSACTCYLGLVIGILLGELHMANQFIFALAGGMFLYISLVDMMPELNEAMDKVSATSVPKALHMFLLQNIGILLGIFSLFFLALYQDDIQIGAV